MIKLIKRCHGCMLDFLFSDVGWGVSNKRWKFMEVYVVSERIQQISERIQQMFTTHLLCARHSLCLIIIMFACFMYV